MWRDSLQVSVGAESAECGQYPENMRVGEVLVRLLSKGLGGSNAGDRIPHGSRCIDRFATRPSGGQAPPRTSSDEPRTPLGIEPLFDISDCFSGEVRKKRLAKKKNWGEEEIGNEL